MGASGGLVNGGWGGRVRGIVKAGDKTQVPSPALVNARADWTGVGGEEV